MTSQNSAIKDLENFANSLPHKVKPSIRWRNTAAEAVNGRTAMLTVDFGYQYPQSRLNPDQNRELISLMRKAVKEYVDEYDPGNNTFASIESCTYLGLYYYATTFRRQQRK